MLPVWAKFYAQTAVQFMNKVLNWVKPKSQTARSMDWGVMIKRGLLLRQKCNRNCRSRRRNRDESWHIIWIWANLSRQMRVAWFSPSPNAASQSRPWWNIRLRMNWLIHLRSRLWSYNPSFANSLNRISQQSNQHRVAADTCGKIRGQSLEVRMLRLDLKVKFFVHN